MSGLPTPIFNKSSLGPALRVGPQPLAGSLEQAFAKFVAARYSTYVGNATLEGYTGDAGGTLKRWSCKIRGGRLYVTAHLK